MSRLPDVVIMPMITLINPKTVGVQTGQTMLIETENRAPPESPVPEFLITACPRINGAYQ
jgi:hypothetical protein